MKPMPTIPRAMLALALLPALAFAQRGRQPAPVPDRAELEAAFEELLSGSSLVGWFTDDAKPVTAKPGADSYRIKKVTKLEGDFWRFEAVIPFGEKELTLPIAIEVKWAGDTPVLTLTDLAIPGMGSFTARILFYGDQYAGTWSSPIHGGHMYGSVQKDAPPAEESEGVDEKEADGEKQLMLLPQGDERAASPADDLDETSPHWPSFRGHRARGVAEGESVPETWDVESGENVLWKTPVPGLAHSSPIVWGNQVFLTSAVRTESDEEAELTVGLYGSIEPVADEGPHAFLVMAYDKTSGELLWERTAIEATPKVKRHPKGSHAASTPATDGEHVVAFFGTEGLYAYDMDGELLWSKDLGTLDQGFYMMPDAQWGFSSSPVLHAGRVLVQCDVQGQSFVAAFDADTGKELWRTERDEVPTFGGPTIYEVDGHTRLAVNGWKHIGGYDFETGEEVWKLVGGGDIPVPMPIVAHDLIFITNAHGRMAPIYAVRADATGELEGKADPETAMAWMTPRRGNYMQTPLVYGEHLYTCSDAGVVACFDAASGEELYRERLGTGPSGFTASPIATDSKLYFTSEEGEIVVIAAGPTFEVIATNEMGETCMATPAISEGTLLWRTRGHLVAIGL